MDWHTVATQEMFIPFGPQKEFINSLVLLSLQYLLTLPIKGNMKEQSGESIMCTCYLLLTLIWTITPAGFAISSHLNGCQEISWSQQKAATHPSSPHKATVLLSVLKQVTWFHSWTHSLPKAHKVSMATLGKLLRGGFHALLKLLSHYSPSNITLTRHCCYVWHSMVYGMTYYI